MAILYSLVARGKVSKDFPLPDVILSRHAFLLTRQSWCPVPGSIVLSAVVCGCDVGQVVLAEYTSTTGNFPTVTRILLAVSAQHETRVRFSQIKGYGTAHGHVDLWALVHKASTRADERHVVCRAVCVDQKISESKEGRMSIVYDK
jgi:hypothetical protein